MIRKIECDKCHGIGTMTCPKCDGRDVDEKGKSCTYCDGLGAVICDKCDGSGSLEVEIDDEWAAMGY